MTVRVNHYQISTLIGAAINATDKVVDVPAAVLGERLTADGALPLLFQPQVQQTFAPSEVVLHLGTNTVLEVGLPFRVKRICACANDGVPFDLGVASAAKLNPAPAVAGPIFAFAGKHPRPVSDHVEIAFANPRMVLVRMPALGPPPECAPNVAVQILEMACSDHMPMEVRPALNDRVQLLDQRGLLGRLVRFDNRPNLLDASRIVGS